MGFFAKLFGRRPNQQTPGKLTLDELSRRLATPLDQLRATPIRYHEFTIPKRTGGTRTILAPDPDLKKIQRLILHRLLAKLKVHNAAHGFQSNRSIVTNALPHVGVAVVIHLDLQNFFPSISATRIDNYFRLTGWNAEAAALLTQLCTHQGALPQGAPTSPKLSNLVNYRLDIRLSKLAAKFNGTYTRYADDLTFSISNVPKPRSIIAWAKDIVGDEGYRLHMHKKLRISRPHDRQLVTGLVVNKNINLPRATRRRLRAVDHHLSTNRPATLTPQQLLGWRALQQMIATQSSPQK